jgi:hypothetical protein
MVCYHCIHYHFTTFFNSHAIAQYQSILEQPSNHFCDFHPFALIARHSYPIAFVRFPLVVDAFVLIRIHMCIVRSTDFLGKWDDFFDGFFCVYDSD